MHIENTILNILEETKKYIKKTINKTADIYEKLKYIDQLKELEDKIKYFTKTTENNNKDKLKTSNVNTNGLAITGSKARTDEGKEETIKWLKELGY